ncbi:MAG: endonuclease MutS2 [Hyphomicrobiales bacterium]
MIYPKNFEEKTGFDKIKGLIKEYCFSDLGASMVDKIRFSNNFYTVEKLLEQTNEFREILLFEDGFPSKNYINMLPELYRLKLEGTFIEPELLLDLKSSLQTIIDVLKFFAHNEEKFPRLVALSEDIYIDELILHRLDEIVDDKGGIRDSASVELHKVRKQLHSIHSTIDRRMGNIMQKAKKSGWVPDGSELTIRNGRLVIPMKAADKRQIKGFVHDESATGQTVFVEPAEILEANNEIRELENAERREIIKILTEFTDMIRPYLDDLKRAYNYLGILDFIRAKARLAVSINGIKPLLVNKPQLKWRKAIHPLLYLSHKEQEKDVIPLDLELNADKRILVISGPNAGGKSVCLKTTGLLQFMLQSGLLVPVLENSEFGIFKDIFIDIGDEQSLENDLSTYSSHLLNMKHFVLNANDRTLLLIDEFGTGTEPQLGGAIAEAVLEEINDKKAFGVITTHYSNLKLLADRVEGIINGAMLYDTKEMKPLYRLKVGNPGSSFAFEIAKKIGFPKDVLDKASEKTGEGQLRFEEQLQQLEVEKEEITKKHSELKAADDVLSDVIKRYEILYNELHGRKREIIQEARADAKNILADSNKLIEKTIREIKEADAEKELTKDIRQSFEENKDKLLEERIEKPKPGKVKKAKPAKAKLIPVTEDRPLMVGDSVKIKGQETIGEITEIKGKNLLISYNSINFRAKVNEVERVSSTEARKQQRKSSSNYNSIMHELNKKMENFSLSIDVRGQRADEAVANVRKYVDEAILLSISEVEILHGKGNGILRDLIREYLNATPEVKGFKDAPLDAGGSGITRVRFR